MKMLTLLAFSRKFTERGLRLFEPLTHRIIDGCNKLCCSLSKPFEVYCKLHHCLHYGDLVRVFGPLYLYCTWHYERMHQPSKKLGRTMHCWVNAAKTIHHKQQMKKALFERDSNYLKSNFSSDLTNLPSIISETTIEFEELQLQPLQSSLHPYRLHCKVLRSINLRKEEWWHTTAFYQDKNNNVYCEGVKFKLHKSLACSGKYVNTIRNTFARLSKLNVKSRQFISLNSLYHSNDYFFKDSNELLWLIEWIGSEWNSVETL
jgi:hypothetical protein